MTLRRRMKDRSRAKFYISRLPENLVFEILKKINNRQLVRMRRTCSRVNSAAKNYERKLASRPALGTNLEFNNVLLDVYGEKREIRFSVDWYDKEIVKIVEGDFEKRISGISFYKITVGPYEVRELYQRILKLFETFRPVCIEFVMMPCPLDLIVPITDCVSFEEFNTSFLHEYIDDFGTLEGSLNVLAMFRKARNRSAFGVWIPGPTELTEKVYEIVKDFGRLSFNTNASGFEELLWDLHNSEKRITMKSMSITFQEHYSVFDPRKLPPFEKILKPLGSKEDVPAAVYLLTLKSQFVFIFERIYHKRQEIYITEKTADAMEEQIMSIYCDPIYTKTPDDEVDDKYEYFEDEDDEHEEEEAVIDPRERHRILRKNVRAIVASLIQ